MKYLIIFQEVILNGISKTHPLFYAFHILGIYKLSSSQYASCSAVTGEEEVITFLSTTVSAEQSTFAPIFAS